MKTERKPIARGLCWVSFHVGVLTVLGRCRGKIVEGRVAKIFKERALLEQAFIKDTSKTVAEHIKAQVAAIGENIQVQLYPDALTGFGCNAESIVP